MKDATQQALADRIKTMRAAIRLKHSIAADREINEVLDQVRAEFFDKFQGGEIPDALDVKKLMSGD
jgi:hypothetical protein